MAGNALTTVRKPTVIAYLGAFIIALSGILFFILAAGCYTGQRNLMLFAAVSFLLTGIFMVADTAYWRINVYKNRIAYRALFRKSRVIEFSEITRVEKRGEMRITVYAGRYKLFAVSRTYPGFKAMLDRLNKENITIETGGML